MAQNNDDSWGGPWTEKKLKAFMKYVHAYLTIMAKNKSWLSPIYFDGFAGIGEKLKGKRSEGLFELTDEFDPSDESIDVYKGAAKRVLEKSDLTFDYYYFIDLSDSNITSLNRIKSQITHISQEKIIVRKSDCNIQLRKLATALKTKPGKNKKQYAALLFLDPFGMQIKWDSIKALENTRSDVWILIPSGVAINRLLPRKGIPKSKKSLEAFFGLSYEDIYNHFYHEKEEYTLFGLDTTTHKNSKPIDKIIELYSKQLQTIWKHVTTKPLILRNSKKVPIFHFIFASNNASAYKIASQIISTK